MNHDAAGGRPRKLPAVIVELPESIQPDSGLAERLRRRIGGVDDKRHHEVLTDRNMDLVTVDVAALQSSLAADVSRTAGLAAIYKDILDFKGAEFHLIEPGHGHSTFGEAVASMRNGIIIGTVDAYGVTDLWPDWDDDVSAKRLVSLQDDESEPVFDRAASAETGGRHRGAGALTEPEDVVLIGWNHRGEQLVRSLDRRLPEGSNIRLITSFAEIPTMELPNIGAVEVTHVDDGVQRWLDTAERPELGCDHAIVLADDHLPPAVSDANVLLTLLALRPPHSTADKPDTVVAELRQRPNRYLASQRFSDDLIVGDALIAMVLAQFAAEPALTGVIEALISPDSTDLLEIRLTPASEYVTSPGGTFRSIQADVRAADGSIALGYRTTELTSDSADHGRSELCLNPVGDSPLPDDEGTSVELVVLTRCEPLVDLTPASLVAATREVR